MEIKITAIKFETVNGRKTGKSFCFGMDPKKMAKYKTEATVRKKIEEYVAKNGVFKRDELKDLRYDDHSSQTVPLVAHETVLLSSCAEHHEKHRGGLPSGRRCKAF